MSAGDRGGQHHRLFRAWAAPTALVVLSATLLLTGRTLLGMLAGLGAVGLVAAVSLVLQRRGARGERNVEEADGPHARDQHARDQHARPDLPARPAPPATDQPRSTPTPDPGRSPAPEAPREQHLDAADARSPQPLTTRRTRARVAQVAPPAVPSTTASVLARCLLQPPTPACDLDVGALLTEEHTRPAAGGLLPHTPRSVDASLEQALREQFSAERGGLVAARAPHGAGITRSLAEALRRTGGNRPVLWVDRPGRRAGTPSPLATLADAGAEAFRDLAASPIIVIDPGHEHLTWGLTLPMLQRLSSSRPGTVVVITLAEEHLAIPALVTDPTETWLAEQVTCHLPLVLDPSERAGLRGEVMHHLDRDDPQPALGPQLMGTERAQACIRGLQVDRPAHARQLAIIALWQLAGAGAYVPVGIVQQLAGALNTTETDPSPATVTAQLLEGEVPLRQSQVDTTRVSLANDLLRTAAAPLGSWPVPAFEAVAEAAGDHLRPHLARVLAAADREDAAHVVLQGLSSTASSELRARTALLTGVLEERRRDSSAAEAAYRAGIACGDTHSRPALQLHLAGVLEAAGALDQAALLYAQVVASPDPTQASQAAFNLGWLREQQRDTAPAMSAYRRAVAAGEPETAPAAAYNLAELLHRQRAHAEAEHFYRLSADSGHPDIAPIAHLGLGQLLERQQRLTEAENAYEVAARSPHEEAGRVARARLQQVRSRRAHSRRARR